VKKQTELEDWDRGEGGRSRRTREWANRTKERPNYIA